jgi:hypothetical protein
MGDVGMHAHDPGGRQGRSPNQNSSRMEKYGNGLSSLRGRAKNLSNAVGYDASEAPRTPRKAENK